MNPPGSSSDKPQLFVKDVSRSEAFFTETLGFVKTEEVAHKGHRGVYLRNDTEYHSVGHIPQTATR